MRRSEWMFGVAILVAVALGGVVSGQNLPKLPDALALTQSGDSPGKVTFLHASHLGDRPDCTRCHPKLFPIARGASKAATSKITHAAMEKGRQCGACHNGKAAFGFDDCTVCHQ